MQQIAPPKEVYERPANRFVAEFLVSINILPLGGISTDAGGTSARFEGQTLRMAASLGTLTSNFALRPEYMTLHGAAPADGNAVQAALVDLTCLGAESLLALKTPGGVALTLSRPTSSLPDNLVPGTALWVGWGEDRGIFL